MSTHHSDTAPRSRGSPLAGTGTSAVPPGWPLTDRPLTVALLGWARLSFQAREGSGYNLSASELAAGLALSGHRVHYLASGMRYTPGIAGGPGVGRPAIRRLEQWRGVTCHELVNSPNLAPAFSNFRNIRREFADPSTTALVLHWLDRIGAEIVHIHSLEGYALDLIRAVRASPRPDGAPGGRPVVVTPHNYWFVCPQVDLLHEEREVCLDYDGGRRCTGCLRPWPAHRQKLARAAKQTAHAILGSYIASVAQSVAVGVPRHLKHRLVERLARRHTAARPDGADATIDPELARGFDPGPPGHDGTLHHDVGPDPAPGAEPPPLGAAPLDANERFLASDRHLVVLDESPYGRRRHAGVAALNHASLVTPPSEFLARVHERMGVSPARIRVVRLGQPHFDQIHRRARRSPYYAERPWDADTATRPLRLAFLGTTRNNKGLDVLIRAVPLLERDVRQRCQFLVRASGWDWPFRRRVARFPEVQFAGGYDLLQLVSAAGEYDVGVLPHIWFENSPLVMLEHFHAGKFVVASRLGGPVEWIVPGRNGLLFPAGDSAALARCITRLVRGEVRLPSPAEIHRATPFLQSYPGHVREVEDIYRSLLDAHASAPGHTEAPATARQAAAVSGAHVAEASPAVVRFPERPAPAGR